MTQPPFDPRQQPFDPHQQPFHPVDYPQAGPRQPLPPSPYPGGMRAVDQHTTALARPGVVSASFVLWVLTALSWPIGSLVRTLAEDGEVAGFGPVMALFGGVCVAVAGIWGAVLLLNGNYHARLGLTGGALVLGVLALAAAVIASRDGGAEAVSWVVIVLRLVLPAAAAALSFAPGTRQYFSGGLG